MNERKSLRALIRGELRTSQFNGREHLVVPVVALVEGVLHAVNAPTPELVLAEEFSKVPEGWNGRPLTWDHPSLNGQRVSANEPLVLEKMSVGQVFNSSIDGDSLKMEGWIDVERAEEMGGTALETLERIKKGETVEISVGVFVNTENKSGEYKGKKYQGIWRNIVPDHLAFLPKGTTGACSVEMGCGAPRAAEEKKTMTLRERFSELMQKFRPSQEDTSDTDLRNALWAALNAVEPGFLGIDAVFPETAQVVYAVAPEEEVMLLRRGYSLKDDGTTDLDGEKEQVKLVTRYETASAVGGDSGQPTIPPAEEKVDMEKKDRVVAIIASGKTCFTEADVDHMMGFDETRLSALENHVTAAQVKPEPVAPTPKPEPKPELTPEQEQAAFLAKHPDIANIVSEHKAAAAAKHTSLVSTLKAAQKVYNEEELLGMSVPQLEKLATLAQTKSDFSGQVPRVAADDENTAPPPIDMVERLKAARSA